MTSTTTPSPDVRRRAEASDRAWSQEPSASASLHLGRPVRAIEREVHHLHEVEQVGDSEWTPWIADLGLVLFFVPVIVLMTALTFAAYYLAS
jgi:hypothetical protein